MEATEKYKDLAERKAKIALREGQGFRMLHDDFDDSWAPGDEPHGIMTFTDEPAPVTPEPVNPLRVEIDALKAIISNHEARLKKDVGGHIR